MGLKWHFMLNSLLLLELEYVTGMRWLANQNRGRSHFRHDYGAHMNSLPQWKILCLLNGHTCFSKYVTIESRMDIIIFWTRGPIFFRQVNFFLWYPFLEPHLTTYHSNTYVRLRPVIEFGTLIFGIGAKMLYRSCIVGDVCNCSANQFAEVWFQLMC